MMTLALSGCERPQPIHLLSGLAQGTTWHVSLWWTGDVNLGALQNAIDAEFDRLDSVLSNYRPDSVIERFNAQATTESMMVGQEIVALVEAARSVSEVSHGCYDLTVKPLFDLWGFKGDTLSVPDPELLARTQSDIGFRHLTLVPPDRLRKERARLQVDLSSIAQGYSVARIAAVVEAVGIDNYIVEIGGEMQTRGHKPDGSQWRIGVERPLPGERGVKKVLTIRRDAPLAVMTSGTYRHYFDQAGKRYSHVLDARTGRPIVHDTVSVTVLDDNPTTADAWSTALLCLGTDDGLRAADRAGIAALFITDNNGQLHERTSTAWAALKDVEIN